MAFELQQGDECRISGDFLYKGKAAFKRGDIVTIEGISPEKDQPGYKYVVHSDILDRVIRLPGAVLKRVSCPRCHQRLPETRTGKFAACDCGWSDMESGGTKSFQKVLELKDALADNAGNGSQATPVEKPRIAYVVKDVTIDGRLAFREGDYVKVEGESSDPMDPEHKYVVTSKLLASRLLLSDEDIKF